MVRGDEPRKEILRVKEMAYILGRQRVQLSLSLQIASPSTDPNLINVLSTRKMSDNGFDPDDGRRLDQ